MVELQIKHRVGNMTLLKSDCAVEKNVANAKISGGDDYDLGNFSWMYFYCILCKLSH